jgi:hypothetical protein
MKRLNHRCGAGFALSIATALAVGACGDREDPSPAASVDRPTTSTAVVTGQDRAGGARFSLNGRVLTVTLGERSSVRAFAGQTVRADCVSQRRSADGVGQTVRWPARSRSLQVRFRSGAGSAPVFCSIDTASLRDRSYHAEAVLN